MLDSADQTISPVRARLVYALLGALLAILIYTAWGGSEGSSLKKSAIRTDLDQLIERGEGLEERILAIQGRILVGARTFVDQVSKSSGSPSATFDEMFQQAVSQLLAQHSDEETLIKSSTRRYLVRKEAILTWYLGNQTGAAKALHSLESVLGRTESESLLDTTLLKFIDTSGGETPTPDPEDVSLIVRELGWFGKLFQVGVAPEIDSLLKDQILSQAQRTFEKILVLGTAIAILGISAFICFIVLLLRFFWGRIQSHLQPPDFAPQLLLEIFTLYLLGMFLLTKLVNLLGEHFEFRIKTILLLNCLGILSLISIAFWPRSSGISFREIRKSLGLSLSATSGVFRELCIGPVYYLAAWVPLLVILIIYSIVLQVLGVEIGKGAHPIVPLLASADDPAVKYYIFALAVIVAPIVEEIMFRGALYGWLRSRLRIGPAVVISALIFAVIHPQGPVGVVPLACIGGALALLREWRQTLIAPMVAHACFNAGTLTIVFFVFS